MKDPAFLFYATDFYEGTRLMLPEERACYIDLLIYQHQNDFIPEDIRRVMMYCSGIDKATLQATLEAKFKLCSKGWYNEKLQKVMQDRKEFSNKQSINGTVGQFWKKTKALLDSKLYAKLKKSFEGKTNNDVYEIIKETNIKDEAMLKAMLEAMLKHLEIEDENEDKYNINWDSLLQQFNNITGKKLIVVNDKARKQIKARLNDGYTKQHFVDAIVNCFNDPFHRENNHKYLTLEFISRPDKMEKYCTIKPDTKSA